ncbi:P27 family phage terminase small subunit [Mesorhizobium sp. KR1-2]|uniref:P27 family phage terminase small subunit n=1 Tax=Mesorhizobium sp. KR1-2 TaxID=3156609 RepID=UPI0032B532E6
MTHLRGVKPALSPDREALTKAPPAPKWFTDHARAEWKRVVPQLIARRIVTKADLAGVEAYCAAFGAAFQIGEHQKTLPLPDLKLAGLQIRYMQTARQLAAEYGLTPTSRARVGAAGTDDDDDDNPLAVT